MPARTKGRAKFDFRGRPFVWWVDRNRWLRVAALDKKFVVAYPLLLDANQPEELIVHGPEFPGLEPLPRPARLPVGPLTGGAMGSMVHQLLLWCHDGVLTKSLPEFVVDLTGVTTEDGFVAAMNSGFCVHIGGHLRGVNWNSINDYLSWPEDGGPYRLVFKNWEKIRGVHRRVAFAVFRDNPQVQIVVR